jgi:CBS domain-containing protein
MKVQDIMARDPVCCAPDTKLQDVAALMAEHHCGEIPVCEKGSGRPIAVVTDRDITCRVVAKGRNPLELTARDCMTSPCITVARTTDLDKCCQILEEHLIRRAPVVDENGNLCGIITQADIACKADGRSVARVVRRVSEPYEHSARLAA